MAVFLAIGCRVSYGFSRNPAILVLAMKHRPRPEEQDDLLRPRLDAVPRIGVAGADRHLDVRYGPA